MSDWNIHVYSEFADRLPQGWPILQAIVAPIHIIPVCSTVSYQQGTNPKYDRRGHESPSGYEQGTHGTGKTGKMAKKFHVRENKGNLEIVPKLREKREFSFLKL